MIDIRVWPRVQSFLRLRAACGSSSREVGCLERESQAAPECQVAQNATLSLGFEGRRVDPLIHIEFHRRSSPDLYLYDGEMNDFKK